MFGAEIILVSPALINPALINPALINPALINPALINSAAISSESSFVAQLTPEQCNSTTLAQAEPIETLFAGQPIRLVNDTAEGAVTRRLGYFFSLDRHLRQSLEQAFASGIIQEITIDIVSQQDLYQVQAQAQNIFDGSTRQGMIRLSDRYIVGDYETACALSLAGIENEFSEILLRAHYQATYGRALQPSVFQESATLALSSLASLVYQETAFQSAEEVRVFLQDTLASFQRRYAETDRLPQSSPEQDSLFIAAWLNERLNYLLPVAFSDGQVEFVVDPSSGQGNVIKPIVNSLN